ncbi:MAG: hypothetical protein BGO43_00435 [Gammaproteobacteria bacterium 39-13]|nr:hypothetical protein [Gammaproteobacteria bacterium]OJV96725.1 MAG: hypothetical protein BGO43_00435 [Gammaproteobacteria bacterium 39-13]
MVKGGIIKLRTKQSLDAKANDKQVTIFAPVWVKKALKEILPALKGAQFEIEPPSGKYIKIQDKLTLMQLLAIARNEQANTTGIIKFKQYNQIPEQTIIALRDLAKHCVIVGKDIATHYGGYPAHSTIHPLNKDVIICDLAGLQFQQQNNTGRHVLISAIGKFPQGDLDKTIYLNTVGEKKTTYQAAKQDKTGRFIPGSFKDKTVLFDVKAYQAFVIQDFLLAATAVNSYAEFNCPSLDLNFKFLKYGAGFFADGLDGQARKMLSENLALAVLKSIEQLCKLPFSARNHIKRIELPFYKEKTNKKIELILLAINKLCEKNNIEFASLPTDALAPTSKKYTTATTNCADPHAVMGNEMHYGSVDAAIAENLKQKGNNFSPVCNQAMGAKFVQLSYQIERNDTFDLTNTFSEPVSSNLLKWSALAGLGAAGIVKAGFALSLGLSASWFAAFAVGMTVVLGIEIMVRLYRRFSTEQYSDQNSVAHAKKLMSMLSQSNVESEIPLSCMKEKLFSSDKLEKMHSLKNACPYHAVADFEAVKSVQVKKK